MTIILLLHVIFICIFLKRNGDSPAWLKLFALSPLLMAPWLMFMSIFFFDAPGYSWQPLALFISVNTYPLLIYVGAFLACRLYRKGHKRWALVPPSLFTLINLLAILAVILS